MLSAISTRSHIATYFKASALLCAIRKAAEAVSPNRRMNENSAGNSLEKCIEKDPGKMTSTFAKTNHD